MVKNASGVGIEGRTVRRISKSRGGQGVVQCVVKWWSNGGQFFFGRAAEGWESRGPASLTRLVGEAAQFRPGF